MRYYGALEAGGTKMVAAVFDENGKLTSRAVFPTRTPAETMPELIGFFREYPIVSLGIGSFGPRCWGNSATRCISPSGSIRTSTPRPWRKPPSARRRGWKTACT